MILELFKFNQGFMLFSTMHHKLQICLIHFVQPWGMQIYAVLP